MVGGAGRDARCQTVAYETPFRRLLDRRACRHGRMFGMKLADITLRLARRADVPTLAAMSRDLIETGLGWHYRPERVAKFLDDPETATVVACDRERTVGFAIMQLFDERRAINSAGSAGASPTGSSRRHRPRASHRFTSSCAPTTVPRTRSIARRASAKPCASKGIIAAAKRRSA